MHRTVDHTIGRQTLVARRHRLAGDLPEAFPPYILSADTLDFLSPRKGLHEIPLLGRARLPRETYLGLETREPEHTEEHEQENHCEWDQGNRPRKQSDDAHEKENEGQFQDDGGVGPRKEIPHRIELSQTRDLRVDRRAFGEQRGQHNDPSEGLDTDQVVEPSRDPANQAGAKQSHDEVEEQEYTHARNEERQAVRRSFRDDLVVDDHYEQRDRDRHQVHKQSHRQ
jgi:hypothetical protein